MRGPAAAANIKLKSKSPAPPRLALQPRNGEIEGPRPAETDPGSDVEADDAAARMCIVTANGAFAYNTDWNGIERAKRPAARAARLLHAARARTDTSRWWRMRWPTDTMSLLGQACGLIPGRIYELLRLLREHPGAYLRKLWQLNLDRRRETDDIAARGKVQNK